jgi:hypothetical protein
VSVFQEQGRTGEQVEMKKHVIVKILLAVLLGLVLLVAYLGIINLLAYTVETDISVKEMVRQIKLDTLNRK